MFLVSPDQQEWLQHIGHLASRLQEAGVQVVYGIVGHKAHAKMLMIVRRERSRIRRYVHLGTGNYHSGTAKLYTDFGLLTCDDAIGEDVMAGYSPERAMRELLRQLQTELFVLNVSGDLARLPAIEGYGIEMIDDDTLEVSVPRGGSLESTAQVFATLEQAALIRLAFA